MTGPELQAQFDAEADALRARAMIACHRPPRPRRHDDAPALAVLALLGLFLGIVPLLEAFATRLPA